MRIMARVLVGLLLVAGLLVTGQEAAAQNYVGKVCWSLTPVEQDGLPILAGPSFPVIFDVTFLGGSTYVLNGYAAVPGDNPALISGFAYQAGPDIYLNMTLTQDHTPFEQWRDTGQLSGKLNASLNGFVWDVGYDRNLPGGSYGGHYSVSSLTAIPCP